MVGRAMKTRGAWVAVASALASTMLAAPADANGVPEVPAPWLNDIALASLTSQGAVIYYNPTRCQQIGAPVCAFFRAHEYGHIQLKHGGAFYTAYFGGRQLAEAEADCFAAKNASYSQVRAAIDYFSQPGLATTDDGVHGSGATRAARLRECRGL